MVFWVDSKVRMSSKNPSVETTLGDAMWQVSTQSPRYPAEPGFPLAQKETAVCSAEHQMPQLVCVENPHWAKTPLIKDQHHTLRAARCSYLREPWWWDVAPGPAGFPLWSSSPLLPFAWRLGTYTSSFSLSITPLPSSLPASCPRPLPYSITHPRQQRSVCITPRQNALTVLLCHCCYPGKTISQTASVIKPFKM